MFLLLTFQHNLNSMLNPIFFLFLLFLSTRASSRIWTLDLRIVSRMVCHWAQPSSICFFAQREGGGGYSNRWSSNFQSPPTGPSTSDPQPPTFDPGSPTLDPRPQTPNLRPLIPYPRSWPQPLRLQYLLVFKSKLIYLKNY